MTKLFLSFTALIRGIVNDEISDLDLATGLFYLGCARAHAFAPWEDKSNELTWFAKGDTDLQAIVHRKIVAALETAELEDRAAWRDETGDRNTFAGLNTLIERNELGSIDPMPGSPYSYTAAQDRIDECGLEIDCVF